MKRLGKRTIKFKNPPYIIGYSSVVGKKEGQGPLASTFDFISQDTTFAQETWEKAESQMQKQAYDIAMEKAHKKSVDFIFAGDLLNQCTSSSVAHRESKTSYFGLYGACSTMAEGLILASMMIDGDFADNTLATASSHFCSAERQYRFPLEYGGQRPQSSQWTVTGSGAVVLSKEETKDKKAVRVTHAHVGEITDLGITDVNNMGAAMAPAAYQSLSDYLKDTQTTPADYDLIVTGDLAYVGGEILQTMLEKDGIDTQKNYTDCGKMIFDREAGDVHSGGSGCGCSAVVLCGYILKNMEAGKFKKVLFAGTGALLSPTSVLQGETISGICHIVCLEAV